MRSMHALLAGLLTTELGVELTSPPEPTEEDAAFESEFVVGGVKGQRILRDANAVRVQFCLPEVVCVCVWRPWEGGGGGGGATNLGG